MKYEMDDLERFLVVVTTLAEKGYPAFEFTPQPEDWEEYTEAEKVGWEKLTDDFECKAMAQFHKGSPPIAKILK